MINALSDLHHPLQTLADLMTLKETFGDLKGKTIAWVGDGNNILHDLMIGALKMEMNMRIATPINYEADEKIMKEAKEIVNKNKNISLYTTRDPEDCVRGADVVITDTWVSMGEESQAAQKKKDFTGYQVNMSLMNKANKGAVFLHCLPRKQEEVTDEVIYSKKSLVFDEAENRMWTVMAVTLELLGYRLVEK